MHSSKTVSGNSLSLPTAQLCSAGVGISYVAVLYLFPAARSRPSEFDANGCRLDRYHPDVIRARLWAIAFSVITSLTGVGFLIWSTSSEEWEKSVVELTRLTLRTTGLLISPQYNYLELLAICFCSLVLTMILFWGPLYTSLFLDPDIKKAAEGRSVGLRKIWNDVTSVYTLRALILGPLTEEIVFRGCILGINLLVDPAARLSKQQLVFLCPLWFGLAHVHNIWEISGNKGANRQLLTQAIVQSFFQFTYTTVFGWYASFIHLRTGSVIAAAACHSFCNFMGLPPILKSLQRFPEKRAAIVFHYALGLLAFVFLALMWANNPRLFPRFGPWTYF